MSTGEEIWERIEARRIARQALMPTERDAIRMMQEARTRLEELGWKDASYCPKDGSTFEVIESGSTGIFQCHYEGEWPKGRWWIADGGDLWPSRPTLYRATPPRAQDREAGE